MGSKRFKSFGLLLVAVMLVLLGTNKVEAVTDQRFTYDYGFHVTLPDELKPGVNEVIIASAERVKENEGVVQGDLIINYKLTEITKAMYDEFKAIQDKIDQKNSASSGDTDIKAFEDLVNEKYKNQELWCYNNPIQGKITLDANYCGKKYYILTVDVEDPKVQLGQDPHKYNWEYMVARVYEVDGTKVNCDEVESPKTGLATPYVICGVVAVGSIAVIALSKKKKFI